MLGIVGAARLENDANPEGTNQKRVLLNCLVALVIFVGLWWQSFIIGCTKFVIGYGVGTWYFTMSVREGGLRIKRYQNNPQLYSKLLSVIRRT